MFGLGIFTYIKIGLVVVLLSVCGYYVWNYHHLQAKVAAQQQEIANLKLGQEVLDKKQQAFDEFMTKKTAVQRRVSSERKEIEKEVGSVDDTGLQRLYDRYRLRPKGQVHPPSP